MSGPHFHTDFWAAMTATAPVLALAYGIRIDRAIENGRTMRDAGHPVAARVTTMVTLGVLFIFGAVLPMIAFLYAVNALAQETDAAPVPSWMYWVNFNGSGLEPLAAAAGAMLLSFAVLLLSPFMDAIGDALTDYRAPAPAPQQPHSQLERVTVVRRGLLGRTTTTTTERPLETSHATLGPARPTEPR